MAGDVGNRTVEQHAAVVDNHHMVEQTLDVVHLVGGDDERTVVGHVAGHDLAEKGLRGDVETIGGLVHHQQTCARGNGKAHIHFLFLTHGQLFQIRLGRHLKVS